MTSVVSSRRPSLANLYNNLKAQSDDPYEDLEDAARLFPIEEDEVAQTYSAPSTSTSPSPPPPFHNYDDSDSESDCSSDSDSDVEPMDLNIEAYQSHPVFIHDVPFIPPRQPSPQIIRPVEITAPPRKPTSHSPVHRARVAPASAYRGRQRKTVRSHVDEGSDADCESTGDATDDEYMPSPPLNPRKRTRSASPAAFRRASASPTASVYSSSTSSDHPNKRARMPPPSRNKQATLAEIHEIQRVERSDGFDEFTCGVCGWVQRNKRVPDFKRHVKTHQRAFEEENTEKGWRCKGVLLNEANDWAVGIDAPQYEFRNQRRVGGCMKTFSRRDALKRHLDNPNVDCVGLPGAATQD